MEQYARAGTGSYNLRQEFEREVERQLAALKERAVARQARARVICGAKTRKGRPCRLKSEPGKQRCKFHGGKSTGPKTAEGKARIAEAQRKRWAEARKAGA
ncbi:HGGxSTG domain-containing protein [Marimonas lutisalis]|uniref:HGGxSTG domain-containing protein n=1 Tax=Marimonas lutisalis TaxID=2545756 RepID=UPI002E27076F